MDDDLPSLACGPVRSAFRAWSDASTAPRHRPSDFFVPPGRDRATLGGVRGDSRRDLYSKALALCGLGVLAGTGALVDYWPVGVRFPATASPVVATSVTAESAAASLGDPLVILAGLLDTPGPRTGLQDSAFVIAAPSLSSIDYESLPVVAVGYDVGTAIEVQSLPEPALVYVRNEVPVLPGASVHLWAPRSAEFDGAFPQAAADSSRGFITGAFRKTGTSIVRTGVKTGASVAGAVRVVGSMMRRALPD